MENREALGNYKSFDILFAHFPFNSQGEQASPLVFVVK